MQLLGNETDSVGTYADERLMLTNTEAATLVADNDDGSSSFYPCLDCKCVNLQLMDVTRRDGGLGHFELRSEPWLTVMLTVAAVGIAAAAALAGYLACKACSEVIEGSQAFSLLLLAVVCMVYAALLPYATDPDSGGVDGELVCALRLHAVPVCYAALFAVLLSRSLMLATADFDGLPGHVSGLTQTFVFVLLAGLQFALSVQEWLIRERPYSMPAVSGGGRILRTQCPDTSSGVPFLLRLSYVMLLLLLQLLLSPFVVNSRRNYREGALFCVAGCLCFAVWLAWSCAYVIVGPVYGEHWFDVCVCAGLVAIPSVIILVVFLPKV